ncbi:MAG TPA: hypothetical protein VJR89_11245, partial [Polyangiales bacterium]|nr:hypothetical protein [Polyangiales bacterium]
MTRKSSLGMVVALLAAAACAASDVGPTAVCDARVARWRVSVRSYDRVDILLVLDASPSMVEERRHFVETQWPRAIQLLLRGKTDDAKLEISPVGNLRVGVISSDLGAGAEGAAPGCSAHGAQARLQNGAACHASKPSFVWHYAGAHDPVETERALRCLADVAPSTCSLSQPLAAARQALSISEADGGFPRENALLMIVILTDRDDCSLASDCSSSSADLPALQGYVDYLRGLRPNDDWSVVPVIIAGAPPDWVRSVREQSKRDEAYDALFADPRLAPGAVSCTSPTANATAPARLLQFARAYGEAAYVHSICDYDLAGAFEEVLSWSIGGGEVASCLRLPVIPDRRGLVPCRVTWELPETSDPEEPLTPVRCDERPGLLTQPAPELSQRSARGRVLCDVRQAPLASGPDGQLVPQGDGFYVDLKPDPAYCRVRSGVAIEFTERARPPNGVTVRLVCTDDTQRAPV